MIRLAKILPSLRCFLWILCSTKFRRHLYWWGVTPSAGCWHGDCRQYLGPAAAKHRQIYWLPPGPGPGQPISLLSLRAVPASLLPHPRLLLHHLWVCLCLRVLSVHCRCCLASIQRQSQNISGVTNFAPCSRSNDIRRQKTWLSHWVIEQQ